MDEHVDCDHQPAAAQESKTKPATVRDPVCGMQVDPAMSKHRFQHAETTYDFCFAGCRTKFKVDPEKSGLQAIGRLGDTTAWDGAARRRVHLSDAPGDPAARAGQLPNLRNGARTAAGNRGCRAERRPT